MMTHGLPELSFGRDSWFTQHMDMMMRKGRIVLMLTWWLCDTQLHSAPLQDIQLLWINDPWPKWIVASYWARWGGGRWSTVVFDPYWWKGDLVLIKDGGCARDRVGSVYEELLMLCLTWVSKVRTWYVILGGVPICCGWWMITIALHTITYI